MTPRQLRDKLGTSQASCCVPRATGDLKAGQSSETPCNQVAGPSPLHGEAHNARLPLAAGVQGAAGPSPFSRSLFSGSELKDSEILASAGPPCHRDHKRQTVGLKSHRGV